MIEQFSLSFFKGFKKLDNFKIKPLTVIVGKNSCGKSSIMQSLLLLKQTLDSNNKNDVLTLEGKYLQFSKLRELTFGLPKPSEAQIGYKFLINDNTHKGIIEFKFKNVTRNGSPAVKLSEFNVTYNDETHEQETKINLLRLNKNSVIQEFKKTYKFLDTNGMKNFKTQFNNFIPYFFTFESPKADKTVELPLGFAYPTPQQLISEFAKNIQNIKYLNPVRAMPKRAYIHYSKTTPELLEDGSNAAHILVLEQNQNILWKSVNMKLADAVNLCLSEMGLKQSISPARMGEIVYKLNVKETVHNKDVSLADVGFGYSQVLPIILMGLLSTPENLMLIEQPEIHLHPSSAANLADLFLGFVQDNKQLIIETHSAELINRLRLRVIENPELQSLINIVFVDQPEYNGEVSIRQLGNGAEIKQFEIDSKGMFPEWPEGFLDESQKLAEAILRARLSKKSNV